MCVLTYITNAHTLQHEMISIVRPRYNPVGVDKMPLRKKKCSCMEIGAQFTKLPLNGDLSYGLIRWPCCHVTES